MYSKVFDCIWHDTHIYTHIKIFTSERSSPATERLSSLWMMVRRASLEALEVWLGSWMSKEFTWSLCGVCLTISTSTTPTLVLLWQNLLVISQETCYHTGTVKSWTTQKGETFREVLQEVILCSNIVSSLLLENLELGTIQLWTSGE